MHQENRSESVNHDRDRVHDETAQKMYHKTDFEGRTALFVEQEFVGGTARVLERHVRIVINANTRGQSRQVIKKTGAI